MFIFHVLRLLHIRKMKPKPFEAIENQRVTNENNGTTYNIVVTKRTSRDTTLKIIGAILFVLLTELCLGLHMHILMTQNYNKVNENFVHKRDIEKYFISLFKTDLVKNELSAAISKKVENKILLSRIKRHNVSNIVAQFARIRLLTFCSISILGMILKKDVFSVILQVQTTQKLFQVYLD